MADTKKDYVNEPESEELFCALPEVSERELDPNIDPFRLAAIRVVAKQWANGTVLHYYFFDQPDDGGYTYPNSTNKASRDGDF